MYSIQKYICTETESHPGPEISARSGGTEAMADIPTEVPVQARARKCAKAVVYCLNAVFWVTEQRARDLVPLHLCWPTCCMICCVCVQVVGTIFVGFGAWTVATGTNVTLVDQVSHADSKGNNY